jgi:hypothetical protein
MKKLLLLLLPCITLNAMEIVPVDVSSKEQAVKLYSDKKNFFVENEDAAYRVENHNVNPLLKELANRNALVKFKDAGYIRINKLEDGKYELAAKVRGEGGGPGGATAGVVVGKFLTYTIGYGLLNLVAAPAAAASGPLAPGVQVGANLVAAPFIESASNVVGIGCGIIGAILTGPF